MATAIEKQALRANRLAFTYKNHIKLTLPIVEFSKLTSIVD